MRVRRGRDVAAALVGALALAAAGTAALAPAAPRHAAAAAGLAAPVPLCGPTAGRLEARCLGLYEPQLPGAAGGIHGYGPTELRTAYGLDGATAGGRLVALVDAFDDPAAESDLGVYRATYGLPPCTGANGCFEKLDAHGGRRSPRADAAWAREISLDLDMLSAACPDCHIALVEADGAGIPDLGIAENTAAGLPGVVAIGNSYGIAETSQEPQWDTLYHHPGIAVVAAAGDGGYGTGYPAASPEVTSVGGTTLRRDSTTTRGWAETPWSGASSGCSRYEPKPAWQRDPGCIRRTIADVSADADPATGVAMYDSYQGAGWIQAGGTSAATAFIAGVYGLAGNSSAVVGGSYPYGHTDALNQVGGGYTPSGGLGTPAGTGAF
jgi:subtilase family serine protease